MWRTTIRIFFICFFLWRKKKFHFAAYFISCITHKSLMFQGSRRSFVEEHLNVYKIIAFEHDNLILKAFFFTLTRQVRRWSNLPSFEEKTNATINFAFTVNLCVSRHMWMQKFNFHAHENEIFSISWYLLILDKCSTDF